MSEAMRPVLLYVLPFGFGAIMLFMPAILQVSFFTATILGMIQGFFFRQPWFRQRLGLLPIVKPGGPSTLDDLMRDLPGAASNKQPKLRVVPRYQAPTVKGVVDAVGKSTSVDGEPKKSFVTTMKADFSKARKELYGKVGMGDTAEKKGARSKSFVQSADAYERKRKAQKKEEKKFRDH
jgi:hypothetical protein